MHKPPTGHSDGMNHLHVFLHFVWFGGVGVTGFIGRSSFALSYTEEDRVTYGCTG